MKVIDLTFPYRNGQIAGNPLRHPVVMITAMGTIVRDGLNTSSVLLGSHTGTHMDAPKHFFSDGASIDQTDLSLCVGGVSVIDFSRFRAGSVVSLKDVEKISVCKRMLFSFGWWRFYDTPEYYRNWPHFEPEAIAYLADRNVCVIAMDTPSPDGPAVEGNDNFPIHRRMLAKKMIFVESLAYTDQIDFRKEYILAALPLKVDGADGAACRVVLLEKGALD